MSSHTVIAIHPATGKLVLDVVHDRGTAKGALAGFCLKNGLVEADVSDAIVLLGMTGSTLLHKSASVSSKHNSYTQAQLADAFESVKDAHQWKGPINKILVRPSKETLNRLASAVPYFTGGSVDFEKLPGGRVWVFGPGYYASVGS